MKTNIRKDFFITPQQREILASIARSRTHSAALVLRSNILLAYAKTQNQSEVVRRLNSTWDIVHRWVHRWVEHAQELDGRQDRLEPGTYHQEVIRVLSDEYRPGVPPRIREEQKQQIIALACEQPADHGVPVTQWSHALLARTVVTKGIVDAISSSHVGRFLKQSGAQTT
jgi:transposase